MRPLTLGALAVIAMTALHQTDAQTAAPNEGATLYQQRCAACHEGGTRAPGRSALALLNAEVIRETLTNGAMKAQAAGLSGSQIAAIADFLASPATAATPAATGQCAQRAFEGARNAPLWSGWGNGPQQRRFQAFAADIDAQNVSRLQLQWAFAFPGATSASSQPAIAAGRLFVGSMNGNVYSLDAQTGCTYWVFKANVPVRTALSIGRVSSGWAVFFGDQAANAYAVDAESGALLWKVHVGTHPLAIVTGAPLLYGGVLYVPVSSYEELAGASASYGCCTFRGSVSALDASSGKLIWKSYTIADPLRPVRKNKAGTQLYGPSGAAIWSAPSLDPQRHVLYVATGDSYSQPAASTSDAVIAFDSRTGKRLWYRQMTANDIFTIDCGLPVAMRTNCPTRAGPDFDFGASPMLVSLPNGRRALIAAQKSGMVYALDPDRAGAILWQRRVGVGGTLGGVEWGAASDARNAYVAVSDVELSVVSPGTAGAQSSGNGSPAYLLNQAAGGGLFALDLSTGRVRWHAAPSACAKAGCSPAQSAAVTATQQLVFSGALDGHLRAYSAADGRMLWDADTERSYEGVNGVNGSGGSLDGPGPVVAGGMLYVNSGYGSFGKTPGNVLLAYAIR